MILLSYLRNKRGYFIIEKTRFGAGNMVVTRLVIQNENLLMKSANGLLIHEIVTSTFFGVGERITIGAFL